MSCICSSFCSRWSTRGEITVSALVLLPGNKMLLSGNFYCLVVRFYCIFFISSLKWKPKLLVCPLVVGCIGHISHSFLLPGMTLHAKISSHMGDFTYIVPPKKTFLSFKVVSPLWSVSLDWVRGMYDQEHDSATWLILAPNDFTSAKWQRMYLSCFGFFFICECVLITAKLIWWKESHVL